MRCLESVSSSRTTSLTLANSEIRSATRADARVNGNNLLTEVAHRKPLDTSNGECLEASLIEQL
jgi:hypothetical protein